MLYPVRVKVGHDSYEYAMITLEQANQKFVVIDGCLVEQYVEPMRACDVEERLEYAKDILASAKDTLSICLPTYAYIWDKLQAEIKQAEQDIAILTLAKQHYTNVELAKQLTV